MVRKTAPNHQTGNRRLLGLAFLAALMIFPAGGLWSGQPDQLPDQVGGDIGLFPDDCLRPYRPSAEHCPIRGAEHRPIRDQGAARKILTAYPEAGLVPEQDESGLYLRGDRERFLLLPAAGCPEPQPDSPADQPLCAMFAQPYPAGPGGRHPAAGFDPGRVRHQALLKFLYGDNEAAVRKNCVPVSFLGRQVLFNARQGAAAALERVGRRLETLVQQDPALKDYLLPPAGSFNWRAIGGSSRLSAHSFAISLDLNVKKSPYWRWSKPSDAAVLEARANYPQALVEAFEAEGFIWGGKWQAYDFMHFEYRPELLIEADKGKAL